MKQWEVVKRWAFSASCCHTTFELKEMVTFSSIAWSLTFWMSQSSSKESLEDMAFQNWEHLHCCAKLHQTKWWRGPRKQLRLQWESYSWLQQGAWCPWKHGRPSAGSVSQQATSYPGQWNCPRHCRAGQIHPADQQECHGWRIPIRGSLSPRSFEAQQQKWIPSK